MMFSCPLKYLPTTGRVDTLTFILGKQKRQAASSETVKFGGLLIEDTTGGLVSAEKQ